MWRPSTAPSWPCGASASRCPRGPSSPSWAPTGRARPPSSRRCPESWIPRRAPSRSRAARSRASTRTAARAEQRAGSLSGGEQQMLAIARALMARPKVMLLDEPSLGLAPKLVKDIFEIIQRINRERGVTVLLVEQNANIALHTADYGYVLELGRIVMEDNCDRLLEKDDIREFYLGLKESSVRGTRRWKRKKTWR